MNGEMARAPGAERAAVVVLHWGDKAATLECLRGVVRSELVPWPLVVIDNGTGSLTPEEVVRAAPGAEFVGVPENLSFAAGSNFGIRRALAAGADCVLLLNNDATLDPACLAALVRVARSATDIAAVGAKVLSATDPTTVWLAWGRN